MNRILSLVLCFILIISLGLSLSRNTQEWSFQSYCEYVTENIEPFPEVELSDYVDEGATGADEFFGYCEYFFNLVAYPVRVIMVVCHNAYVLFDGFFPASWNKVGQSGGGTDFGGFGGGGIGGGGGGAR